MCKTKGHLMPSNGANVFVASRSHGENVINNGKHFNLNFILILHNHK
jgi:hypothetical protein